MVAPKKALLWKLIALFVILGMLFGVGIAGARPATRGRQKPPVTRNNSQPVAYHLKITVVDPAGEKLSNVTVGVQFSRNDNCQAKASDRVKVTDEKGSVDFSFRAGGSCHYILCSVKMKSPGYRSRIVRLKIPVSADSRHEVVLQPRE